MAGKVARACFDKFQQARVDFASEVAEMAAKPHYVDALRSEGVMEQLRPLLTDTVASVQNTAALALGRLANYSTDLAEEVVSAEILPQLVYSLDGGSNHFQKAAAFVLRSVAKHSPELAEEVVGSGAVPCLVRCLEEEDVGVRESAAWALGYIAAHTEKLAEVIVTAGAIPLLIVCVQEPEVTLKRIAASALSDVAKHAPHLAEVVSSQGAVPHLAGLVQHPDAKLKRQVCAAMSQIAKHSPDLAELIMAAGVFPSVVPCLSDPDQVVRRNAAVLVREVVKHSEELSGLVVKAATHGALVEYTNSAAGTARLPSIMALGYIASFSESLSASVIAAGAAECLKVALVEEPGDPIKSAAAWALGQVGRHSADHAKALAMADVLRHLLAAMLHEESSEDLQGKAKRALKAIVAKCLYLPAMQFLLRDAPPSILVCLLKQFAKVVPSDPEARRELVASGGLKIIQEVNQTASEEAQALVDTINAEYPADIVEYCSPHYEELLATAAAGK